MYVESRYGICSSANKPSVVEKRLRRYSTVAQPEK
eukprot:IDg11387t1